MLQIIALQGTPPDELSQLPGHGQLPILVLSVAEVTGCKISSCRTRVLILGLTDIHQTQCCTDLDECFGLLRSGRTQFSGEATKASP
jgi:hypothetical protein